MKNKKKKSDPRDRIYNFLVQYTEKNRFSPTVREICAGVGLKSTSSVHFYLNDLEDAGKIKKNPAHARAIKIIDRQKESDKGGINK